MAARVELREISNEEGNRLLRIVRRTSGSVVTWRRAQMVLLSAQGMDARHRPGHLHEPRQGARGDPQLQPRRLRLALPAVCRRATTDVHPAPAPAIKKIALSRPADHGLPFSTWSLAKLADYLVAEGVVEDISHEGLRELLRRGCPFQAVKTWKQSTDPDYEPRRTGCSSSTPPPSGASAIVVCSIEFGPPEPAAASRRQGLGAPRQADAHPGHLHPPAGRAAPPGRARPGRGQDVRPHQETQRPPTEFLAFCRYLRSLYPPEVRIAIVLDNFSPHLSTKTDRRVGEWAAANNVELAYMPTYASWLNRIEASSPPCATSP